ncbi:MAG: hypothetical protein ABI559_04460 [Chloroflexota bacterium]
MTFILSLLTQRAVLQVSDRVVTWGSQEFDAEANKVIVYLARNAVVAIAYSGKAYIDGVTTDHWIAEQISDTALDLEFGMRIGPRRRIPEDLGASIERLKHRATREYSKRGSVEPLEITCAGFQWKTRRLASPIRPVFATIQNSTAFPGGFQIAWNDRHHFYPLKNDVRQRGTQFALSQTPMGWMDNQEGQILLNSVIAAPTIDDVEARMVDAVRDVARKSNGQVGPNCMSVLISNTDGLTVRVRYLPTVQYHATLRHSFGEMAYPAAFTPWLISPGLVQQPHVIIGGTINASLGELPVVLESPPIRLPATGPRLRMAMSHQRRKGDPMSPRKPDRNPPPRIEPSAFLNDLV